MRKLRFIVKEQLVEADPNCDFSGLVPGTKGYLEAAFSFSPEWSGYTKIASFYSVMGKELPYQILKDGESCVIPEEALKRREFKIQILGKRGDSVLTTNRLTVKQDGGRV